MFSKPNGHELWVLLLEKAFARMWGSYAALDGNVPSVALEAFTGNVARRHEAEAVAEKTRAGSSSLRCSTRRWTRRS